MSMEWSREKILKLIDVYKNYPVLWNVKHTTSKNKIQKNDAWQEVAKVLGEDRGEIERKVKNLLSQFNREVKKINECKNSPGEGGEVLTSKWFAFDSLIFLIDRYKPRSARDEATESFLFHDELSIENTEGSEFAATEIEKSVQSGSSSEENEEKFTSRAFLPQIKNLTPKRRIDRREEEASTSVKSDYEQKQDKDEYCIFGEYVACKVRKLSSHYARANVQHLINNILWEADMGKYDVVLQNMF